MLFNAYVTRLIVIKKIKTQDNCIIHYQMNHARQTRSPPHPLNHLSADCSRIPPVTLEFSIGYAIQKNTFITYKINCFTT